MTRIPVQEHPGSIAITGMAARLPGARSIDEFWWNLREGVESITRHTRAEMLANGARPDRIDDPYYVNASAPLDDGDCFDAEFFGYSAREASITDPQHRIFLECAYHALEDAGYSGRGDVVTGVYGGCTMNTYILHNVMPNAGGVAMLGDLPIMVGNDKDFMVMRVSYKLDLRGPSIALQTACSTSLVAVHMACRALLDGECDVALAGGSSMRMPHAAGYLATPGGTAAADGHCRAFDADAAGSVVGSGVGVIILKRLADALRDGDQVHAVIRGSAITNDGGAKASFTAPSVDGQSRAVLKAIGRAGVSAREISFVEAHGTGTPLGDPIEVAALSRALSAMTEDTNYCWLGSAKPNIGHLDAAAGVAGLIKVVLSLKHRSVPPVVNYQRPNPHLDLDSSPFKIATELTRLESDGPLVASVNSLAMGGANAHVIIEEAPSAPPGEPSLRRRHPVLLSARSAEALENLGQSVGRWARENPGAQIADVAYTLATGRREHPFRRAVHAGEIDDIAFALSARGSRRQREGKVRNSVRTAFLFPGQGEQFPGMGEAAQREPVLGRHLDTVVALFAERTGIELKTVLFPGPGEQEEARIALTATEITQPALFAVEWAFGRTLMDFGIHPYAMLGHSIGELVGAALAGVMSVETAVDLVAARGRLMGDAPEGAMLYVSASEDEVTAVLPAGGLAIAAINAERLVVVSGTVDAVSDFEKRLRAEKISCGRLNVTRAFHSALTEPAAAQFRDVVADHSLTEPSCLLVSNVTGRYLERDEATSPDYWASQIRSTVRFADGLSTLAEDGVTVFIEVGPGLALTRLATATQPGALALSTLGPEKEPTQFLDLLTDYWIAGGRVDWSAWYADEHRRKVSLPLYPFARTRHWLEPSVASAAPAPVVTGAAPAPVSSTASPQAFDGTPMQRYVASLWRALLGNSDFGLHGSFFEAGGHSLLAMQLVNQVRKDGATELEMTDLFGFPTVAGLAEKLEELGMRPPQPDEAPPGVTPSSGLDQPPADQAAADQAAADQAAADQADAELASLLAEVNSLSDEEVRARLAELDGTETE